MTYDVSRRSLLALGAGLSASTMLGGSALARAPKLGTQPAYFYRFGLGDAEVTVVSDGPLPLGPPKGTFIGVPDEEVKKMLSDNFLSPDNVVLEQNSPIVNMGDKLVLFDTGMGTLKAFGPTTGRQQKSMAEAGIKPSDIDAVVLSHAHIDHIGGIVDADNKPLFPNAQYYIAQSDFDFWTDEGKLGSPLKDFVTHARKNLLPVRDRLVLRTARNSCLACRRWQLRAIPWVTQSSWSHRQENRLSSSAISPTTRYCCWKSRGCSSPTTPTRIRPPKPA
jgi:glyoxylase-like metal-dependent hydrolase (beta-lactamase superfamily II)